MSPLHLTDEVRDALAHGRPTYALLGDLTFLHDANGLVLGPADRSGAMGLVGQTMHPAVLATLADAVARSHAAGKPIGTIGGTVGQVTEYLAMGFDFIAVGSDLGLLVGAAQAALMSLRAGDASRQLPDVAGPSTGY